MTMLTVDELLAKVKEHTNELKAHLTLMVTDPCGVCETNEKVLASLQRREKLLMELVQIYNAEAAVARLDQLEAKLNTLQSTVADETTKRYDA